MISVVKQQFSTEVFKLSQSAELYVHKFIIELSNLLAVAKGCSNGWDGLVQPHFRCLRKFQDFQFLVWKSLRLHSHRSFEGQKIIEKMAFYENVVSKCGKMKAERVSN